MTGCVARDDKTCGAGLQAVWCGMTRCVDCGFVGWWFGLVILVPVIVPPGSGNGMSEGLDIIWAMPRQV